MSGELDVNVCQRCGRGYVLTKMYRSFLARWGRPLIVPVLCPTCFLLGGPLSKVEGTVKWFSPSKHYGFLKVPEEGDVFFHQQQLLEDVPGAPQEGQAARFHMRNSPKGPEALNIEIEG